MQSIEDYELYLYTLAEKFQRLLYHCSPIVIDWYGYEILKGEMKLSRYDSQPHPGEKKLESSYPHHKHVPPNMSRNRIPAPEMSFSPPNLPVLIREIDNLIKKDRHD